MNVKEAEGFREKELMSKAKVGIFHCSSEHTVDILIALFSLIIFLFKYRYDFNLLKYT